MLLGLNGATTMQADLVTDIRVASEAGYGFLEIWAAKLEEYLKSNDLSRLRELLSERGIQPVNINAVENINFQPADRFAEVQRVCTTLCERAQGLGCSFVIVVPSPLPAAGISESEIKRETVAALERLLAIARRYDVGLAFEFLGEPGCSVGTLGLANEIVEEIADPRLGLVLDVFHFYSGGSSLESIERVDPKKLFIVHLNDSEDRPLPLLRDEHRLLPGEGVIPLGAIVKRLAGIGYRGVYSIELFRPEYYAWEPYRLAVEARERMASLLASVQ